MQTHFSTQKVTLVLLVLFFAVQAQAQQNKIAHWRPYDQRGVNQFEDLKADSLMFEETKVRIGGHFTQQYQGLTHENTEVDVTGDGKADNVLYPLSSGFNLATANFNLDVQLADGIRLNLVTYLSSRHHPEAWVKGGFIQFDKMPFESAFFDNLMKNVTVRVGHMEINYGDSHFRRTDNGNAIYNPFVGNYIVDAFNTEIGGEVYWKTNGGLLGMVSVTGGEINGNIQELTKSENDDKAKRSPSIIGKIGFDKQLKESLRLRLTGSVYHTASSAANHLFDGDRGGSRYYLVMVPPGVSPGDRGVFASGRYNPGFSDRVTSLVGNAFIKFKGLELFGTVEQARGRSNAESADVDFADLRGMTQVAGDLILRLGKKENFFIGGRYNTVSADHRAFQNNVPVVYDVQIDRYQIGAGWFMTRNILAKIEYVNQEYDGFPPSDLLFEGKFNGIMIEAAVGF